MNECDHPLHDLKVGYDDPTDYGTFAHPGQIPQPRFLVCNACEETVAGTSRGALRILLDHLKELIPRPDTVSR